MPQTHHAPGQSSHYTTAHHRYSARKRRPDGRESAALCTTREQYFCRRARHPSPAACSWRSSLDWCSVALRGLQLVTERASTAAGAHRGMRTLPGRVQTGDRDDESMLNGCIASGQHER